MTATVDGLPVRHAREMSRFLWLDLTRRCQLACVHCYNSSGPLGTHGEMTWDDWVRVLDQAADAGVTRVQLIGGEPTLHPDFAGLLTHALSLDLRVEVFSNLVHISERCWEILRSPGVSLATSYYSDVAAEHDAMTGRRSHRRTRANIAKAVALGIPVRAGVIAPSQTRRVQETVADLESLGVGSVGVDRVRAFGRGAEGGEPTPANLCGNCGDGRAAIGPDGQVTPCAIATWMAVGNVRQAPLGSILSGAEMVDARDTIRRAGRMGKDEPQTCYPDQKPCYPANQPCVPKGDIPPACNPDDVECSPGGPLSSCNPRR
ncbi:radical SAM protein [Streptomyces ginkgonis]|uniref:radical SAM protein n=2 Tax=Streptomyces TaxID=1883 RepID=UPI0027E38821|nr:radical SAM protein [Streptomyces ginkgonis]